MNDNINKSNLVLTLDSGEIETPQFEESALDKKNIKYHEFELNVKPKIQTKKQLFHQTLPNF